MFWIQNCFSLLPRTSFKNKGIEDCHQNSSLWISCVSMKESCPSSPGTHRSFRTTWHLIGASCWNSSAFRPTTTSCVSAGHRADFSWAPLPLIRHCLHSAWWSLCCCWLLWRPQCTEATLLSMQMLGKCSFPTFPFFQFSFVTNSKQSSLFPVFVSSCCCNKLSAFITQI